MFKTIQTRNGSNTKEQMSVLCVCVCEREIKIKIDKVTFGHIRVVFRKKQQYPTTVHYATNVISKRETEI